MSIATICARSVLRFEWAPGEAVRLPTTDVRCRVFVSCYRVAFVGVALALVALNPSRALAISCTSTLDAGANVGSAISSAAAGATICLNNGNYGGFSLSGINKNPRVIVQSVNPLG